MYGGVKDRIPDQGKVARAVKAALASNGFPSGEGATSAEPIKAVTGANGECNALSGDIAEMCPNSGTWTVTVVAFGPSLQDIRKTIKNERFRGDIGNALRAAGATDIADNSFTSNFQSTNIVHEDKIKIQYTQKPIPSANAEKHQVVVTMTAAGDVGDYDDVKKEKLKHAIADLASAHTPSVDSSHTSIAITPGSVIITATIEVEDAATAASLLSYLREKLASPELASAALGIAVESAATSEAKVTAAVSPPSTPLPRSDTLNPRVNPQALGEAKASNQSTNEEEVSAGGIFLIILLVLVCVTPIFCYLFARLKYGAGKEGTFFKYYLSHSNPTLPFLYIPREDRDKLYLELTRPAVQLQDSGTNAQKSSSV